MILLTNILNIVPPPNINVYQGLLINAEQRQVFALFFPRPPIGNGVSVS